MNPWLRGAGDRLLVWASRLRRRVGTLPRAVRLGRLGTWSTVTLVLLTAFVLTIVSLVSYTGVQLARFERTDARRTMVVYAAAQPLQAGLNIKRADLALTLGRLRYTETRGTPGGPGQFHRTTAFWD